MADNLSFLRERIVGVGLCLPRLLTLSITNGCNLQCRHCWPDSRPSQISRPVPAPKVKRLIRQFADLRASEVCLTGGEPLTHPDWFELVEFCCSQPGFKAVRLQTNGTLLDKKNVDRLKAILFKGLSIQISLEGATAPKHDHVRGRGSFDSTLGALRLLAEAGLGGQTVVAFTETHANFEELPLLLELLDSMGIGQLVSATLVQGGRAALSQHLAPPDASQYRNLIERYHNDPCFKRRYDALGNIAALEWRNGPEDSADSGCQFILKPYVTAEGLIHPCVMLHAESFAARGAFERPLAESLSEVLDAWVELKAISRRRAKGIRACTRCPGRALCCGGCMGRAYAGNGDFLAVEDRCHLRRAVYAWNGLSHPNSHKKCGYPPASAQSSPAK